MEKMKKIKIDDWKPFEIEKLFTVKRPKSRSVKKYNEGEIPFVSSGNYNNGVDSYREPIDDEDLDKGNCITVSPVDGSTFYQPKDFLGRGGGGSSIMLLYNDNLNKFNGLFIASVIRESLKIKYQYNDMGSSDSIKKENILLPALDDETPDWNFMEEAMKRLETRERERESTSNLTSYLNNAKLNKVDTSKWKEFKVKEIFVTEKKGKSSQVPTGSSIPKRYLLDGKTPRISATNIDNGILGYYEDIDDKNYRVFENFISVSFLGTVFYHKYKASLDMKIHCLKLKNKELNKEVAFYLTSIIRQALKNTEYKDQISSTVLPDIKIKLPIDSRGNPDWDYMERYIENLKLKCNIANYNI